MSSNKIPHRLLAVSPKIDAISKNITEVLGSNVYYKNILPEHNTILTQIALAEHIESTKLANQLTLINNYELPPPTGVVYYVRPDTHVTGDNDGTSYENAWSGLSAVDWSSLVNDATLYLCGTHEFIAPYYIPALVLGDNETAVVRGDYPADNGSIVFTDQSNLSLINNNGTKQGLGFWGITLTSPNNNGALYLKNGVNIDIRKCVFDGVFDGVVLAGTDPSNSITISNNIFKNLGNRGVSQLIRSPDINADNIVIEYNYFDAIMYDAIRLSLGPDAWLTPAKFSNITIQSNVMQNCGRNGILVRNAKLKDIEATIHYGVNYRIDSNAITKCGTPAGDSGSGGGIAISGAGAGSVISNNIVSHCFVTGGGIQTSSNKGLEIHGNVIHDIYAGTKTDSYQQGYPIDANGIFIDNHAIDTVVSGNLVYNLAGTGGPNSGVAYSFWDSQTSVFRNNISYNTQIGLSFGYLTEVGNVFDSNIILKANIGISQVGNYPITTYMHNNVFCDVTTPHAIEDDAVIYT